VVPPWLPENSRPIRMLRLSSASIQRSLCHGVDTRSRPLRTCRGTSPDAIGSWLVPILAGKLSVECGDTGIGSSRASKAIPARN
jgi:hypothetical protein